MFVVFKLVFPLTDAYNLLRTPVCPKEIHLSSKVWGVNIPVVSPLDLLELPWPWWSFIDSCCIVYNSGCVSHHLWMEVLYHPGINWFWAAKHAEWFLVFTGTKPKTACFCGSCCSIALLCCAMALHQFSRATNKLRCGHESSQMDKYQSSCFRLKVQMGELDQGIKHQYGNKRIP